MQLTNIKGIPRSFFENSRDCAGDHILAKTVTGARTAAGPGPGRGKSACDGTAARESQAGTVSLSQAALRSRAGVISWAGAVAPSQCPCRNTVI